MTDALSRAIVEGLESQQFSLRREALRLREISHRLAREPDLHSWRGVARNAFDSELAQLRGRVDSAVTAVEEALANTVRAAESMLRRVE